MSSRRILAGLAIIGMVAGLFGIACQSATAKKSAKKIDGQVVFKQLCAQCHSGGGNKVKPGKPLAGSDKLKTLGYFKQYLSSPVGHMPYYKHVVSDKRTLNALYQYCKSLPASEQSSLPKATNSIANK